MVTVRTLCEAEEVVSLVKILKVREASCPILPEFAQIAPKSLKALSHFSDRPFDSGRWIKSIVSISGQRPSRGGEERQSESRTKTRVSRRRERLSLIVRFTLDPLQDWSRSDIARPVSRLTMESTYRTWMGETNPTCKGLSVPSLTISCRRLTCCALDLLEYI